MSKAAEKREFLSITRGQIKAHLDMGRADIEDAIRYQIRPADGDAFDDAAIERAHWLYDAIKVPRKRTSVNARSKAVENKVSRYLWGADVLRVWQDSEDLRYEGAANMIGEVKTVLPENVFGRGGPWAILEAALYQTCEALGRASYKDTDGQLIPYCPFSVLVPVGTKVERGLAMLPAPTHTHGPSLVMVSLEVLACYIADHPKAAQQFGWAWYQEHISNGP